MSDAGWMAVGTDGTHHYSATALSVFWPEPQYRDLIARWPHLSAHLGETWDEHRQRTERHCALVERSGVGVNQLPGDVAGFEAFLTDKRVKEPVVDDLLGYPDLRTVTVPMTSWPPARTAACWCGSGRKYKQCCRRHGLGALD